MTQNMIELRGREMVGQQVKLVNCRYGRISDLYDKHISSNQTSISVYDVEGRSMDIIVNKSDYGEFFLSIKEGQKLNIAGQISAIRFAGISYLVRASKVEKAN